MSADLMELGRRAVACEGWRWMPGMLAAGPPGPRGGLKTARVEGVLDGGDGPPRCVDFHGRRVPAHYVCQCDEDQVVPDFRDPATLGCLLALVREAWPGCHAEPNGAATWDGVDEAERGSWWAVYACVSHRRIAAGATEAEALVAALEAAGGVT